MSRDRFFPSISDGERNLIWAFAGTCILGAMLACIAVLRLSASLPDSQVEIVFTSWTALAGFVGAAGGFWSSYKRWFGHAGPNGWFSAVIGAFVVSGVGSVIAGTLILPIYGTMFGPLQLTTMMIATPMLAVVWFGMLMCAHGLLLSWRSERDSIFGASA